MDSPAFDALAVVMRFDSLREIEASALTFVSRMPHLQMSCVPKRSTLGDANAKRNESIFGDTYFSLLGAHRSRLYNAQGPDYLIETKASRRGSKEQEVQLLTNSHDLGVDEVIAIYQRRWQIESLFKQLKQNFPLRYFYGVSENAIKTQIWVTLVANLLLTLVQRSLERHWSFSGLATMMRIILMPYIDMFDFFEHPKRDWECMLQHPPCPS